MFQMAGVFLDVWHSLVLVFDLGNSGHGHLEVFISWRVLGGVFLAAGVFFLAAGILVLRFGVYIARGVFFEDVAWLGKCRDLVVFLVGCLVIVE